MKISLVTVCYNSEKTIEETLKSVLNQTYKNYEYIIIDGLSKDNTLDIVRKYEKKFKGKLKLISENDNGLYDAMNKGLKLAMGDILGILNSDDILANNCVFETIVKNIKGYDGLYSDLLFLDEETMTKTARKFIAGKYSKKFGWYPPHPTLYLKKEVYNKIGYFNLKYKIAADLDLMLKIIKNNYKLNYIEDYFVYMRSGGISTNGLKGYLSSFKESYLVLKENKIHFPFFLNCIRSVRTIFQIVKK